MFSAFSIARLPRIELGAGSFDKIAQLAAAYGRHVLLVTGSQSFINSEHWQRLHTGLKQYQLVWEHCTIGGEPSPQLIDELVRQYESNDIDVVVGIGGGSALDAAKAIAGLLKVRRTVMDYLEGVGPELDYTGPAVPWIAVPTTAGTGSEATKNAVLSVQGPEGFKKSFRDDKLVAEYAIIDPELLESCPPALIAANGMDALTQLIESYVSLRASPFTDALAISGLRAVRDSLLPWYEQQGDTLAHRANMGYAALLSGITLAQCGLGSVHGLASPLGAFHPIPHGVVCGSLVAAATAVNINAMLQREPENPALKRYARLADILCEERIRDHAMAFQRLLALLQDWTKRMQLPRLSSFGLHELDLEHIIKHCRGSSMKTNPIILTDAEVREVLSQRL